ncbi:MAG: hypothetical protein R3D59_06560 [Paracoccaceae bacterium]
MTETDQTTPRSLPALDDADTDLPPSRAPHPGAGREALVHWIITIGGFTALLLIGLYFTK